MLRATMHFSADGSPVEDSVLDGMLILALANELAESDQRWAMFHGYILDLDGKETQNSKIR